MKPKISPDPKQVNAWFKCAKPSAKGESKGAPSNYVESQEQQQIPLTPKFVAQRNKSNLHDRKVIFIKLKWHKIKVDTKMAARKSSLPKKVQVGKLKWMCLCRSDWT